jgi:MFS family permease
MFFLGWAICALIVPPRADKIGRKLIVLISLILTSCAMIVILFAGTFVWLALSSLILGLTAPGRITVAFVYLMEFITPEWKTFAASLSSLLFVMCFALVTIYLKLISATANHLIAFGILLGLTSCVCIYHFLEESPLFLIKTG